MKNLLLGIDVGGTKIAAVAFDAKTGKPVHKEQESTEAKKGIETVCAQIEKLVGRFPRKNILSVGVGVPGLVTPEGVVTVLPHIALKRPYALQSVLQKRLQLPVTVDNDARCFAFAEAIRGKGKGRSVVIGITLGTGVGGGIVIGGKVFRGADGFAGEVGHMLLQPGITPAGSGDDRGEVEQFLSGTALRLRCAQAEKPGDYLEGEACEFLHPSLVKECAWLFTSLTHLLNPSIIILGGSVGKALVSKLPLIKKQLKSLLLPGTPLPQISVSTLPHAGALGAALLGSTRKL